MESESSTNIIWFILIILFLINIFFIIAQMKFVNAMPVANSKQVTKKVWLWTQIIPIWNYLAFMIALFKMESQFNAYIKENDHQNNSSIKNYSTKWGMLYFIGVFIPNSLSFGSIIMLIGFIAFWYHIYNVKKSLILFQNTK